MYGPRGDAEETGLGFLETDGGVAARDIAAGDRVWHEALAADGLRPVLDWQPDVRWHAGWLLVVTGSTLLGLAPDTGRIRWRFEADGTLRRYWTPADGRVILSTPGVDPFARPADGAG